MTHKLATWIDQFGTSGCVGCGRCITWCPVGIDITEEVRAIRDSRGAQRRHDHGRPWNASSASIRSSPGSTTSYIELVAGCARTCASTPAQYLFREGEPADEFF